MRHGKAFLFVVSLVWPVWLAGSAEESHWQLDDRDDVATPPLDATAEELKNGLKFPFPEDPYEDSVELRLAATMDSLEHRYPISAQADPFSTEPGYLDPDAGPSHDIPPSSSPCSTSAIGQPKKRDATKQTDRRSSRVRKAAATCSPPDFCANGGKAAKKSVTKAAKRKKGPRVHKIHPCQFCSKVLETKYKLDRHLRTHTGEKPFECEVCRVRFNQKSSRKTHSTIHARDILRRSQARVESGEKTRDEVIQEVQAQEINGHLVTELVEVFFL